MGLNPWVGVALITVTTVLQFFFWNICVTKRTTFRSKLVMATLEVFVVSALVATVVPGGFTSVTYWPFIVLVLGTTLAEMYMVEFVPWITRTYQDQVYSNGPKVIWPRPRPEHEVDVKV